MSRILNPTPVLLTVEFSELTGQAKAQLSRPIPFPLLVMIFCQILIQFAGQAPAPNGPDNTPANGPRLAKGGA